MIELGTEAVIELGTEKGRSWGDVGVAPPVAMKVGGAVQRTVHGYLRLKSGQSGRCQLSIRYNPNSKSPVCASAIYL